MVIITVHKRCGISLLISLLAFVAVQGCRSVTVTDGHTPGEQRRIAEACLSLLHSPLANEMDIDPHDPRLPEIIRGLQPIAVEISGTDVVIMRAGKPAEYHLSRRLGDAKPWVLYIAGNGYNGHQELIRLDQN